MVERRIWRKIKIAAYHAMRHQPAIDGDGIDYHSIIVEVLDALVKEGTTSWRMIDLNK